MLVKRAVVLAKVETTYNTDAVPGGTDAVLVEDAKWSIANLRMHKRMPLRSSIASLKSLYAGSLVEVSFTVPLKGSGTAGTAPEADPLYLASGMDKTVVALTSVAYGFSSDPANHKSVSMYFYEDGFLVKVTGAIGKPTFDLQTAVAGKVAFTFTGHFVSLTEAALATPTYDSTVEPVCIGMPITVAGYGPIISKISFDPALEIATPDSISSSDGYGEIRITGRAMTGSFDPERVALSTHDFMARFRAGTTGALDTGVVGGTAGNRWQITCPAINYTDVKPADKSGIGSYDVSFEAVESATDDEFVITFT